MDDSDAEVEGENARAYQIENLYKKGKLIRTLAGHLRSQDIQRTVVKIRGRCLTSIAVTRDDLSIFLGDKNGDVYKYDMQTQKLLTLHSDPRSPVNDISCNHENTMFATAHDDGFISLWDSRTCKVVDRLGKLYGHRGPVYGVCFQKQKESILFSASKDRTVKMWACDDRVYMRTLFGHRSSVLRVHTLETERAVSVSDDKQPRMWKTEADSVLAFKAQDACLEDTAMISEFHFTTVSTDGTVALYHRDKQKPIALQRAAHGHQHTTSTPADGPEFRPSYGSQLEKLLAQRPEEPSEAPEPAADSEAPSDAVEATSSSSTQPNWVHSVAAIHNSDLIATGSCDGVVRLWEARTAADDPALRPVGEIPLGGWVNGLAFTHSSQHLIACSGPYHRFGRWLSVGGKGTHNQLLIARLPYDIDVQDLTQFAPNVEQVVLPPPRTKKAKKAAAAAEDGTWAEQFGWKEANKDYTQKPAAAGKKGGGRSGKRARASFFPNTKRKRGQDS